MSTCKDCLHYEACKGTYYTAKGNEDILYEFEGEMYAHSGCEHFKNRANYVEVVKCENCKFACFRYNADKYPFGLFACKKQPTGRMYKKVKGNHFCSYGERKINNA